MMDGLPVIGAQADHPSSAFRDGSGRRLPMSKDFRVGLMTGVVLAGAALVWVATRPSLSPQARIASAGATPSRAEQTSDTPVPWGNTDTSTTVSVSPSEPPGLQQTAELEITEVTQSLATPQQAALSGSLPQSTGPDLTIHELDEPIKTTRFHIVRKNENLSTVAQQYYGSQDKWHKIVGANSKTIKDPNRIAPGTKLIIPE